MCSHNRPQLQRDKVLLASLLSCERMAGWKRLADCCVASNTQPGRSSAPTAAPASLEVMLLFLMKYQKAVIYLQPFSVRSATMP